MQATSRDGSEIPFTLVYNKQYVNSNSPCILYLNQEENIRGPYGMNNKEWLFATKILIKNRFDS